MVWEKDSNAYAKPRDERILRLAEEFGVEVRLEHGRHLFEVERVILGNGGKGTMTLHQWQNVSVLRVTSPVTIPPRPCVICTVDFVVRWDIRSRPEMWKGGGDGTTARAKV